MRQNKTDQYTVVRHSAFGYKGDMQFSGGLESRSITTKADAKKVTKEQGALFDGYRVAEDFAFWAMYTACDVDGFSLSLTPQAGRVGGFSRKKIDGLQIFVPKLNAVDAFLNDPNSPMTS